MAIYIWSTQLNLVIFRSYVSLPEGIISTPSSNFDNSGIFVKWARSRIPRDREVLQHMEPFGLDEVPSEGADLSSWPSVIWDGYDVWT